MVLGRGGRSVTPDARGDMAATPVASSADDLTTAISLVGLGRVLGERYELVSILGSGGMATVFLARDRVLHRDVAVKVLRDQLATDPVFLARFSREALNAARLSHPGLVTIFDAGVDHGTAYIVMELVHGRTVQEMVRSEGPLAITRAVRIAADVCAVLAVAHRADVVHRDIKPGNILVGDDGRTRVFDFGIARTSGSAGLTEISTVIGTAAYLSPEQAAGEPAGSPSDLYSLGCVLDEMLTGSPPFAAETPVALLHRHVHDDPAAPSARRPEVSDALDAAVLHLLAKDPAARPATADEARRELLASLPPTPTATSTSTASATPTATANANATLILPAVDASAPQVRRRAIVVAAIVAAIVVAVVASVALVLLLGREDGAPVTATGTPTPSLSSATPTTSASARSSAPTPSITVPRATTSAAALVALRRVIAAGQSSGLIGSSAADQLLRATDDVASTVDKKKGKSAVPRIQDLADLVDSLAASGQVAATAVSPLDAAISQLQRLVEQGT